MASLTEKSGLTSILSRKPVSALLFVCFLPSRPTNPHPVHHRYTLWSFPQLNSKGHDYITWYLVVHFVEYLGFQLSTCHPDKENLKLIGLMELVYNYFRNTHIWNSENLFRAGILQPFGWPCDLKFKNFLVQIPPLKMPSQSILTSSSSLLFQVLTFPWNPVQVTLARIPRIRGNWKVSHPGKL